jgi:hypothetical protein
VTAAVDLSPPEQIGRTIATVLQGSAAFVAKNAQLCEAADWWIEKECSCVFRRWALFKTGRTESDFKLEVAGALLIKLHAHTWGDDLSGDGYKRELLTLVRRSIQAVLEPERKWARQRRLSHEGVQRGKIDGAEDQVMSTIELVMITEDARVRRQAIERCIRALKKVAWQQTALLKQRELSWSEIAGKMNATVDTVEGWWRRAKPGLEKCLAARLKD